MTSKELSQKIISLTHAYMREVEEFIRARDMAGMHACEERWREEIERVCEQALSRLDKPTTDPEKPRLMVRPWGSPHTFCHECIGNGCLEVKQ